MERGDERQREALRFQPSDVRYMPALATYPSLVGRTILITGGDDGAMCTAQDFVVYGKWALTTAGRVKLIGAYPSCQSRIQRKRVVV